MDLNGAEVAKASGMTGQVISFAVDSPNLWSPENPYLYNVIATLGKDSIKSYTGFRTISKATDSAGVWRPLLNGKYTFLWGPLDQVCQRRLSNADDIFLMQHHFDRAFGQMASTQSALSTHNHLE